MILKKYQKDAVNKLLKASVEELNKNREISSIVFKSPTWSWKTIMMQNYLKEFSDLDLKQEYCFLWISINDLSNQSKRSFEKNLEWTKLRFSNLNDIQEREIKKNEILFINWEKIRSVDKKTWEWKVLAMKDNERDENLPNYLKNTHNQWRKVILIVDESHKSLDTVRAQNLIKNYIKPVLQIEVSATPDSENYQELVNIEIEDVIKEEMIKKKILVNSQLKDLWDNNLDSVKMILDLAIRKQKDLLNSYDNEKSSVKPLLLIQLPSEKNASKSNVSDLDLKFKDKIQNILEDDYWINFDNQKLAIWLSDKKDKINKEIIDIPNSPVEILIFKQAIATWWDCPRAQILVMFREIKSFTFELQTVWRILRMPEWKHYEDESLNKAYVYTNLPKAEIWVWEVAKNMVPIHFSERNNNLYEPFYLKSVYKSRLDYQDIWKTFYDSLAKTLVENIWWKFNTLERKLNLKKLFNIKNFKSENLEIINSMLSDWKILVDIDNHTWEKIFAEWEIQTKTDVDLIKMSFDDFARDNVKNQFSNISRSYKKIFKALYYTFDNYFFNKWEKTRTFYQKLILNNKNFFIDILNNWKDEYLKLRLDEINKKKIDAENKWWYSWTIPKSQWFTEKAKLKDYKKDILQPSYINSDSDWEKLFIEEYLEKSNLVKFWYNNWTKSEDFFAIPYTDEDWETQSFYPDFIVYFNNWNIWIFDPKKWFTLKDWKLKAKWLEDFIKKHNSINSRNKIIWWLISWENLVWEDIVRFRINKIWNYNFNNIEDFELFWDDFIENYDFEESNKISEKYKNKISEKILILEKELKERSCYLKKFLEDWKRYWEIDFSKINELNLEINSIKNRILVMRIF